MITFALLCAAFATTARGDVDCGGNTALRCADCPLVRTDDGGWTRCFGDCVWEAGFHGYCVDKPMNPSRLHASCCQYVMRYGMIPFETWGTTPKEEQKWYTAHNCDSVIGGSSLSNCGLIELGRQQNCRCTSNYSSEGVTADAFCSDWDHKTPWCYLSGGLNAKSCPGAKKSIYGDFYYTSDNAICNNAWASYNGYPKCTGLHLEKPADGSCCPGATALEEPRALTDPLYCSEGIPGHGKTCFSTIQMCRPDYCLIEIGVNYPNNDIGTYNGHLASASLCREACIRTSGCKAWSFYKYTLDGDDNCWLKTSASLTTRRMRDGFDSGVLCQVKSFNCLNLEMPTSDEITSQHCSPGLIDVLAIQTQTTEGVPVSMSLTSSVTNSETRSTQTAFTQEHGWNLEQIDSSMISTTKSTQVTMKDPATSQGGNFGVEGFEIGFSSSTSCMNANTELCAATHYLLPVVESWFGKKDDRCKCKETTTTTSETDQQTHTTNLGQMENQSQSRTDGFEVGKETYESVTRSYQCPEYSECVYSQYTATAICSIPYWGTCTTVFDEFNPAGENIRKTVEIARNDKNKYLITKSAKTSNIYVRSTGKATDGNSCGVQITPAVDNSNKLHPSKLTCPKDANSLPNCDCMLTRFKDCQTSTHSDNVLKQGDFCQLGNRPSLSGYDDVGACLQSEPTWRSVNNCFGADIYVVSGYNKTVYGELLKGIRGQHARPDTQFAYDFDMVKQFAYVASHDTSGGYVHDGGVLLDGKDSTYWNVINMPSWNKFWYVVFDSNSEDTVVSEFKIMNYGDVTHDARKVLLQCSNDKTKLTDSAGVLAGAQFSPTTGNSDWQTFANTIHSACRYWKVSVLDMADQPWLRQVSFVTSNNSGRRLQEDNAEEGHMLAPLL